MDTINKFQPLIILLSVAVGIILGQISFFELHSEYFILPFLVIMLYTVFIQIPLNDIKDSLKNLLTLRHQNNKTIEITYLKGILMVYFCTLILNLLIN